MTAQTQAQALTITIGGTNYTNYLAELNIGFESWGSRGVIKKTGEIALVSISGGVSLDPRDNSDFDTGKTVTVSGHPLAGSLLILSPPTIEPLLSDIPATSGNLVVKIPVGCRLAYYDAYQPDDDQSGVTLGTGTPGATVVRSLLTAADVPPGSSSLGAYARQLDYPLQKQGGGFVAMAGDVTYSALDSTRPGFLYCDNTNTIRTKVLDLDAGSLVEIELGVNDKEYLPQLDGSLPPGTVQAVGVRRRVTTESDACQKTYFEESGVIRQTFEVCRYEDTTLDLDVLANGVYLINVFMLKLYTNINLEKTTTTTLEYIEDTGWIQTGKVIQNRVFSGDGFILFDQKSSFSTRGNLNAELSASAFNSSTYGRILTNSLFTSIEYSYAGSTITKVVTKEWKPACVIYPDGFVSNGGIISALAWNMEQSLNKEESWEQMRGAWTYKLSERKARKLVNPDWVETIGETAYDLIVSPNSKTEISNTGDTQPPRPETWEGLSYEEEDQLQAEASFSTSRQREVLQIPYAFSTQQMQGFAETEGEIIWGRAYQYLIECEPNLFNSITAPLPVVRVRGAGENRTFLADAIQWSHSDNTDYVAFAGIYLGGSGGTSISGGSYSRASTIAPLIVSPVGAAPTVTPTGNPRPPQASDGLIAVGFLGTVTVGSIGGGVTVT